jgi:hypothetical protein
MAFWTFPPCCNRFAEKTDVGKDERVIADRHVHRRQDPVKPPLKRSSGCATSIQNILECDSFGRTSEALSESYYSKWPLDLEVHDYLVYI